jgi:hypothetical protein
MLAEKVDDKIGRNEDRAEVTTLDDSFQILFPFLLTGPDDFIFVVEGILQERLPKYSDASLLLVEHLYIVHGWSTGKRDILSGSSVNITEYIGFSVLANTLTYVRPSIFLQLRVIAKLFTPIGIVPIRVGNIS